MANANDHQCSADRLLDAADAILIALVVRARRTEARTVTVEDLVGDGRPPVLASFSREEIEAGVDFLRRSGFIEVHFDL